MPPNSTFHTKWQHQEADAQDRSDEPEQVEFDFGSMCGSVPTDQEMCAADEVFFNGQILPLRHSFSSDRGLTRNDSRSVSRSESMDHCSSAGFTSINSSSKPYKPKHHNLFHAHPSPNPQIRTSGPRTTNRSRRWSVWDFFRLGLVQTPEIELENLKLKVGTSNCKSNNKDGPIKKSKNQDSENQTKPVMRDGSGKSSGFLRGCKCSVETVSYGSVMVRSKSTSTSSAMQQEMKKKETRKKVTSRHRSLEWSKEVTHGGTLHHQIVV